MTVPPPLARPPFGPSLTPAADPSPEAPDRERSLQFRPDIEGLRAVAIVLVVLYHAGWRWMRGGYLGVDVFFVLSGFLISGLLVDEVAATGRISLTKFWARRARRLLPAAALVTLVVIVANALLLSPLEQGGFAGTALAFSAYGSNILFAVRSTDYFGGAAVRDPLLHTWSLSVEEQFYLFFAPSLLLLATWARRRGPDAFRRWFTAAAAIVAVGSGVACLLAVRTYPVVAFYALPTRAWEFALGALALVAARRVRRLSSPGATNGSRPPSALGLEAAALLGIGAVLAVAMRGFGGEGQPLGPVTLVPTVGTALLLAAGAGAYQTSVARVLATSPFRLLGRLSYSWYLWHWPVLVYLHEKVPGASLRLTLAAAFLALVPAAAAYAWVESPIRFSPTLRPKTRQALVGALALAALTSVAALGGMRHADQVLATPRYAAIAAAQVQPPVWTDGCLVDNAPTESPRCTYGPARNDTTVVLFGDSHAAQWFPTLDSIATVRGWRFVVLAKAACPASSLPVFNLLLARRYTECERWRENALARVASMRPALVVVSDAKIYDVLLDGRRERTDLSPRARDAWRDGLTRTLGALAGSGARLLVLQDTPRFTSHVPRCLARNADPARCAAPAARALAPVVADAERAAAQSSGAAYASLNFLMCGPDRCPVVVDGVVRYRDTNHMSERFAASLAPVLSDTLTQVLARGR
jgi:peptidoglycan/LPS O-acetylase OafA/YrhL